MRTVYYCIRRAESYREVDTGMRRNGGRLLAKPIAWSPCSRNSSKEAISNPNVYYLPHGVGLDALQEHLDGPQQIPETSPSAET